MSDQTVTLKLTADARGAVTGVEVVRRELDGLGTAGRDAGAEISRGSQRASADVDRLGNAAGESATAFDLLREMALDAAAGIAATVAAAAGLGQASRLARELETGMAKVSTLLSDTSGIDGLRNSVRELARDFGTSAAPQAAALADVIGAGFEDAAQSIEILTAANQLALGGFTQITTAVDGVTTALNTYGPAAGSAGAIADKFFQSALSGKSTIEQLSASIGSVAPIAAQTGVSLDQILAATATLTRGGISTSTAMDGLRATISAIIKPSSEAADLAQQLGLQFDATALRSKGLATFLDDVRRATGGSADKLAVLFGGVEALLPVMALTGTGAEGFARDLDAMADSAGVAASAVAKVADTGEQQLARLRAAFESELTDVGQLLNTALSPAVVFLTNNLGLISDGLTVAASTALVFAGIKGLSAIPLAAGAVSTAMAAVITSLNLVNPLWAYATQGMAGTTAAMLGMRNAGAALFAMIGGWPTIIAAATVGIGLLLRQIMSAQEQAIAAAQETGRQYDQMWARYTAAQQMARARKGPDPIAEEIRAQEALIARMTGRFSEQSVAMQSARERLVALQAEYVKAGGSLESLTGTTTASSAAVKKFTQDLRDQTARLQEQAVRTSSGEAGLAKYRASMLDMSSASKAEQAEIQKLIAGLGTLEAQVESTKGATSGRAAATRDAASADLAATAAAQAHAAAMDALAQASGDFEQLRDRVADSLATPAERAQREYQAAIAVVDEFQSALMQLGPIDPALFASLEQTRSGLQRIRDQAVTGGAEMVDSAATQAQQWSDSWDSGAEEVMQSIERWAYNGFRGLGDSLSDMMRGVRAQLVAMFAEPLVVNVLGQLGIGGQGGLLQGILGGLGGGSGLLGSVGGLLGLGRSGTAIDAIGQAGTAFAGGGVGGLGALGALGGVGTALGGFSAGLGVAGSAGLAAAGNFGLASLAAGNFAVGLGALAGALGPVALGIGLLDRALGGRIFGRGFQAQGTTLELGLGGGGATASLTEQQRRRGSLFGGRSASRDVARDVPDDARRTINDAFSAIEQQLAARGALFGERAPEIVGGTFRRVYDNAGRLIKEESRVLGVLRDESFEAFGARVLAESTIALIDRNLAAGAAAVAESISDAAAEGFEGGAAAALGYGSELESGIATMLKGASTAVQGEASRIADRWRSDAETLADGAQMLLLAATDIRSGAGLLGDGSLTAVADLIEDMAVEGESLAAAYARVSASTQMLEQALELSGLTLDRTREEFVRLAAGITEAAGGLDRAQQLWRAYYDGFFTEQEQALLVQQRAMAAAVREFEDIGRSVGDFQGEGGLQAFRSAFDQVLQTGSAEAIVQWLEAAEALGILTQATAQLGTGAALVADSLAEFMASIDGGLAQLTPEAGLAEQLAAQRAANAELLARAQELGASEAELARVRQLGDARIREIVGSVAQQTATLTGALRRLGISLSGSAEDVALLASTMSADFESLVEEFLGSFYDPAEQGAMRLALAQSTLTSALEAAGLATDELISRAQLRAQIEAALASGNIALAESLLRVASALNAVDTAAGNAAGTIGAAGNNGNGSQFGTGLGGSGLGFGGDDPTAGAGQNLVNTIEDIQAGLRDWLAALTRGDLSPLRPAEQLRDARAELARLVAAAQGGDLEAMRQLSSAGDQVLRLGQQVFRGPEYRALFDEVRRLIGGVAGVGTPVGGGGTGGGGRPGDDLGDLGRSALGAAAALDLLAARAGMPPGALTVPPPRPLPQFGVAADQASAETSARPVVTELQRGRDAAAQDNARLRAEIAALAAEMRELRVAAERQAQELARSNDYRRV